MVYAVDGVPLADDVPPAPDRAAAACFAATMALELGASDPEVERLVTACFSAVATAVAECVRAAQRSGDIDPDAGRVPWRAGSSGRRRTSSASARCWAPDRPPQVVTAPSVELVVDADELGWQSRDTDQDMKGPTFREKQIALLVRGTIGGGQRPVEPVVLPPGRMLAGRPLPSQHPHRRTPHHQSPPPHLTHGTPPGAAADGKRPV